MPRKIPVSYSDFGNARMDSAPLNSISEKEKLLLQHFAKFISDHKKNFIAKVLADRTRQVTVVLENIYQSQNASAVLRTCECLGVQDVHIVENTAKYELNVRVLKGSDKWLTLKRYRQKNVNNTELCYQALKHDGYRILVTDPAEDGLSIDEVDPSEKIAIVFGNELNGTSSYAIAHADARVRIPMYGFTESLNISVSAAICLSTVLGKLRREGVFVGLSEEEQQMLTLSWYRKIVKRSEILEREFLRAIQ
jgi:tRNA (guanosine-2'-O-)-methyltransferase